jgi:hypothetical protein
LKRLVLFVEGGGKSTQDQAIRKAFRIFLKAISDCAYSKGIEFRIIPCGSRLETFKRFRNALSTDGKDVYNALLVDSESSVAEFGLPWKHLKQRQGDGWDCPDGATDDNCHLMAQAMEAYFFADPEAVVAYYGSGFNKSALGNRRNVEEIDKDQLVPKLEQATRSTKKGLYHKINHAPDLLEKIDPAKVCTRAPHCDRLFRSLLAKLGCAEE